MSVLIYNEALGSATQKGDVSFLVTRKGTFGCTVYGPYVQVGPGRHCAEFTISLRDNEIDEREECCGFVDVTADNGSLTIARANLYRNRLGRSNKVWLPFELKADTVIETRVHTNGTRQLLIELQVVIEKAEALADKFIFAKPAEVTGDALFVAQHSYFWSLYDQGVELEPRADGTRLSYRGVTVRAKTRDDIGLFEDIFCNNDYQLECARRSIVIDIGMNVGFTSLFFARNPNIVEIHAFEPFSGPFERALENFTLNPNLADKISANLYGLGDANTEFDVFADESNTIAMSVRGVSEGKATRIMIRDAGAEIGPIVKRAKAAGLDVFVKIDCEGSEFAIFESFERHDLLGAFRGMLVEWHKWWDADKTQCDLTSRLLAHDYVVFDRTRLGDPWAGRFNAVRLGEV